MYKWLNLKNDLFVVYQYDVTPNKFNPFSPNSKVHRRRRSFSEYPEIGLNIQCNVSNKKKKRKEKVLILFTLLMGKVLKISVGNSLSFVYIFGKLFLSQRIKLLLAHNVLFYLKVRYLVW